MPGTAHHFTESHSRVRTELFTDAVFAIAMTLLAIELHVPDARIEAVGVAQAMADMLPVFIGFVVSFLVTGLFWSAHSQTWKYVTEVSGKLLWLNIVQLMFVALIPFSSGLYAEHVANNVAFGVYCVNLALVSLFGYLMRVHVIRTEHLVEKLGRPAVHWMKARALVAMAVFIACIPLAMINPWVGRSGFVLIFVVQALLKRHYLRKSVAA